MELHLTVPAVDVDAHQFSLNPKPVDARTVVYDAVAGFVPSARDWGLRLEVVRGTAAPADLDPERLARANARATAATEGPEGTGGPEEAVGSGGRG